jgi:hypothetical protein
MATVLALAAAACGDGGGGDDGGLTLAEYFRRFDALDDDVASQQAALRERFPNPTANADTARDFYTDGAALLADAATRLGDLAPPSEVEDVHDRVVEATRARADAAQAILDDLAEAETRDDVVAAVNAQGGSVQAAIDQLNGACDDLQAIADENDVVVDLQCDAGEAQATPTATP